MQCILVPAHRSRHCRNVVFIEAPSLCLKLFQIICIKQNRFMHKCILKNNRRVICDKTVCHSQKSGHSQIMGKIHDSPIVRCFIQRKMIWHKGMQSQQHYILFRKRKTGKIQSQFRGRCLLIPESRCVQGNPFSSERGILLVELIFHDLHSFRI